MKSISQAMKSTVSKGLFGVVVFAIAGSLMAQVQLPTPTSLSGGKVISADDGKKLLDKKAAFFVDTRNVVNFGKGHVPGANAIPYKGESDDVANFDAGKDKFELNKLPPAKDQALVFYSDGPTGWKSYKAAVWAVKAGYKNVNYMRAGWSEWQSKGFPSVN